MIVHVDQLSCSSVRIETFAPNGELSCKATAFAMRSAGQVFVLTNRHVVFGYPERSTAKLYLHPKGRGIPTATLPLRDKDDVPFWFEHPELGLKMDVVAFPVQEGAESEALSPYDPASSVEDMAIWPGMAVSIVGFPLGHSGPVTLPIWKTGHIATDVVMDCPQGPCFYVDATTRGGMSGSPVYLSSIGGYQMADGNYDMRPGRRVTRWLGLYSGRIDEDADIGIVWKAAAVLEILTRGVRAKA